MEEYTNIDSFAHPGYINAPVVRDISIQIIKIQ